MLSTHFDVLSHAQNAPHTTTESVESNSAQKRASKNSVARRFGSLAVAAAVAGSGLVAAPAAMTTATANAAETTATSTATETVKKTKASLSLKFTKKTWNKGDKAGKVTIKVTNKGKKATGKVRIYDGKKRIRTLTLSKGAASYTFSKKLSAKKHKLNFVFSPSGASKKTTKVTSKKATITIKKLSKSQKIVKEAKKYVGVRYVSGGSSPKSGFDCSGFTSYVYKKAIGKKLPRTSSAQRLVGKTVSKKNAKPGDIIWSPGHVAIYLGNNKIIDAPRPGKTIQVRTMWQSNAKFIHV